MCFGSGPNPFCCSNKCGLNGRCQCNVEGESCAATGGGCCLGLTCGEDKTCVKEKVATTGPSSNPTRKETTTPSPIPTRMETATPLHPISRAPTKKPVTMSYCVSDSGMCFKRGGYDVFCCSKQCDSSGRCVPQKDTSTQKTLIDTDAPSAKPTIAGTDFELEEVTSSPTVPEVVAPPDNGCDYGETKFTVEIQTGKFGDS